MKFEFEPIGYIKSCFKTRFGTPRQSLLVNNAKAELQIRKDLQPELSLDGLSGFSHIWLIFVFHENTNKIFRPKVHPPRLEGKTIGAFATRTPHRPNPIGLSLARLEKVENDILYLSGVDLVDGTPVLDIKPYLKYVESVPDAKEGWVEEASNIKLPVLFYDQFDFTVQSLDSKISTIKLQNLKKLIVEVLERDPRPLVYKEPNTSSQYRDEHAIFLDKWDIHFYFDDNFVHVFKIDLAK